jgi:hypothetical protein
MGAQQHVGIEIEGVMHRPGRVMAWDVERFKVVVVVFDLWAFGNAVANAGEELLNALQSPGDRVQTARGLATARQCHVDGFGRQFGSQLGFFKQCHARIENACNTFLGNVDQRTDLRTLFGRQITQGLHHLSQFALLAKVLNPDLFQGIDIFSALHSL